MTIMEAINTTDNLKHNTYTYDDKVKWLARLDGRVKREILDTHEGRKHHFWPYDNETDPSAELLIPEPFDEIYLRWLEAQIDYANGEYSKYNNSIDVFNALWQNYVNYYNRNHLPKSRGYRFF